MPYNKLVKEINQVRIGNVYKLEEHFQGVMEDETTQGCFRKLILLFLAVIVRKLPQLCASTVSSCAKKLAR